MRLLWNRQPGGKHNQWCVDHDHVAGAVRELLCKDCNIVLGLVEDSPEHLQRLMNILLSTHARIHLHHFSNLASLFIISCLFDMDLTRQGCGNNSVY